MNLNSLHCNDLVSEVVGVKVEGDVGGCVVGDVDPAASVSASVEVKDVTSDARERRPSGEKFFMIFGFVPVFLLQDSNPRSLWVYVTATKITHLLLKRLPARFITWGRCISIIIALWHVTKIKWLEIISQLDHNCTKLRHDFNCYYRANLPRQYFIPYTPKTL